MTAVTGFDASRPNIARVYDYWLGGKDNFAADRELAQKVCEINPGVPAMARDNRAFATQAVTRQPKAASRSSSTSGPGCRPGPH